MKKAVLLLLFLIMVFSFTACKGTEKVTDGSLPDISADKQVVYRQAEELFYKVLYGNVWTEYAEVQIDGLGKYSKITE